MKQMVAPKAKGVRRTFFGSRSLEGFFRLVHDRTGKIYFADVDFVKKGFSCCPVLSNGTISFNTSKKKEIEERALVEIIPQKNLRINGLIFEDEPVDP